MHNFLYNFGDGWDDGDGAEVGCFGRATGFMDGVNNGMLPGGRKLTGCETGVENEEKNITDGFESKLKDRVANTVRAIGRGTFHGKENGTKRD